MILADTINRRKFFFCVFEFGNILVEEEAQRPPSVSVKVSKRVVLAKKLKFLQGAKKPPGITFWNEKTYKELCRLVFDYLMKTLCVLKKAVITTECGGLADKTRCLTWTES
jgi:hypothetical protein